MGFTLDQFSLTGKVAVVTGAGSLDSIGAAYARGLAQAGASIVVADRNRAGADAVASELVAAGHQALAVTVDISDKPSVDALMAAATSAFGGVDILVNNAALMIDAPFDQVVDYKLDDWNRMLSVNLTGALLCTQAAVGSMRARGGGKIVNQLSGGAFPAGSAYGITKLALLGLTTTLARQLGPDNINVNAIAPGATQSAAGRALTPDGSPFIEFLKATVAMRPKGEPDELVGTLLLLVSPAGAWITGQTIHVDGGWVIRP